MVLAANSDKVKTLAGQENAISELVRIVRASEADKPVLKAALGALAVLSSDDRNLKKMVAEGLTGLLESSAKDKDERIVSTAGIQPSLFTSNPPLSLLGSAIRCSAGRQTEGTPHVLCAGDVCSPAAGAARWGRSS